MSVITEIRCIQCPLACLIELHVDKKGKIEKIDGYQCKEGKAYARQEYEYPNRVLTTTVKTESSIRPVLPVRSGGGIPKDLVIPCVQLLSNMKVTAPRKMGDIIVSNIMDTGVDIICTDDLSQ